MLVRRQTLDRVKEQIMDVSFIYSVYSEIDDDNSISQSKSLTRYTESAHVRGRCVQVPKIKIMK